ncbi:bifunctional protein-disulfide isomerase/oxidoreductase DsbC [Gayadomonas joobiniege]|uniref:bifunctional protein-disulfide isomerase/oxidoreductase DsbC n=1 Tax=Gayadomonas joobiniege TaxID=1234606 RepID=UPI00037B7E92|nr:bifunctional protein-disulfide isomerase/oxidoreductase DsbC [Gayadomonas joobiniege]
MIKNFWRKTALAASLLSSAFIVSAADSNEKIKQAVEERVGLAVEKILPSPVSGLSAVLTNRGLFYVSNDGSFFIHGQMYDMDKGMANYSENILTDVRKQGLKDFSGQMISYKAKDEKYQINVFTDITCGYCRKMHKQIEEYNALGITVNYLAFPRNGINSKSFSDMVSVWCADDEQQALTDAKLHGDVKQKQCKNPVKDQYEFGQQVGVSGTPAVLLQDGQLVPGYRPPADMLKILQG